MAQRDFSYGMGELVEATKSAGATLGGILKDRLNKKEYDDFLAGPNKDFSDHLRSAQDLLLDETNPEAAAQGMKMLHMSSQTLFDEAGKYPDNPYVAARANQVFNMNMQFLKQEFVMQHKNAELERQKRLDVADIAAKKAAAIKDLAAAGKSEAGAELAGARAEKIGAEISPFFGPTPGALPGVNPDEQAQTLWDSISSRASRPLNESQRKQVDVEKEDIRLNKARLRLAELAARGEKREVINKDALGGKEIRVYDPNNESDLAAVAQMIDRQEVDSEWTMRTAKREAAAHGLDPSILDKKYGVVVDPTKASMFNPLTKPVPEQTVGKILLGVGGWSQVKDPSTNSESKTIAEAATRLPDDLNNLSGPLASFFQQLPVLAKDENITSVERLQRQMVAHGMEIVTKTFGNNLPDDQLDEGIRKNREAAAQLVAAMTAKYTQQVAERMGIVKPQPKITKGLTDKQVSSIPGLDDLFGAAGYVKRKGAGLLRSAEQFVE